MNDSNLASEWVTLQNQFDSYEKYSLLIKLCNIIIFCMAFITSTPSFFILVASALLWFQDSIWKTFQARIEGRLLTVEKLLANDLNHDNNYAFQFNRLFSQNRKQGLELVKEYLYQSLRPTVAFPHIIIALALIVALF